MYISAITLDKRGVKIDFRVFYFLRKNIYRRRLPELELLLQVPNNVRFRPRWSCEPPKANVGSISMIFIYENTPQNRQDCTNSTLRDYPSDPINITIKLFRIGGGIDRNWRASQLVEIKWLKYPYPSTGRPRGFSTAGRLLSGRCERAEL